MVGGKTQSCRENLAEEKSMLVVVIEDARNTINTLQEDLITAKDTILDLTDSLSESHAAREETSRRAAAILENINDGETKGRRSRPSRAVAEESKGA